MVKRSELRTVAEIHEQNQPGGPLLVTLSLFVRLLLTPARPQRGDGFSARCR
jgi:hypothetical protein